MKDTTKIKIAFSSIIGLILFGATVRTILNRKKTPPQLEPAADPVKPALGNGFAADAGFDVTIPADPMTTPLPLPTPIRTPDPAPVPDPIPVRNEPDTKPVHNNVVDPPKPPINSGSGYQTGNSNLFTDDSNAGTWDDESPVGTGGIPGLTRDIGIFG